MTNSSKHAQKYSTDVENMIINTWDRERTSTELKSFIERHINIVGELDASEYSVEAA